MQTCPATLRERLTFQPVKSRPDPRPASLPKGYQVSAVRTGTDTYHLLADVDRHHDYAYEATAAQIDMVVGK